MTWWLPPLLGFGPWRVFALLIIAPLLVAEGWLRFASHRLELTFDRQVRWWVWHWFTGGPALLSIPGRQHLVVRVWRARPWLDTTRSASSEEGVRTRSLRRAARAGVRLILSMAVMTAEYLRSGFPGGLSPPYVLRWSLVASLGAALFVIALSALTMRRAWVRWWVKPIAKAAWKTAGWEGPEHAASWIKASRDRKSVKVKVHPEFSVTEKHKDDLVLAASTRGHLGEVNARWALDGRHGSVTLTPAARLPELVPRADRDVQDLIDRSPEGTVLVGLGKDDVPVRINLEGERPHVLISAGTGGGKSTILANIVSQVMGKDPQCRVVVIDGKRHSHKWLAGLAGVTYAREESEIHDVLIALGAEARARNVAADNVALEDMDEHIAQYPRILLVCEEMNATMKWLRGLWEERRTASQSKTSPAIAAFREILFMARAVRINVLAAAQRGSVEALGGGDARENFAWKILAEYSPNTWNMLVPDCEYVASVNHPGWAVVCRSNVATPAQMLMLTQQEAIGYVGARTSEDLSDDDHGPWGSVPLVASEDSSPTQGGSEGTTTNFDEDDIEFLTLREATDRGLFGDRKVGTVRQAIVQGFGDPPQPVEKRQGNEGDLYSRRALEEWEERRRQGAKSAGRHPPLVYFIAVGGRPRVGGEVKIGWTENLTNRLKHFALHKDDVLFTIADDEDRHVEGFFHRMWQEEGLRIHKDREWFRIDGSLVDFIEKRTNRKVER